MKKAKLNQKPTSRRTVLFPGRFQPFHKGHYRILKHLLQKYHVIVAIGSADRKDHNNPFSARQRKTMIQACFPKQNMEFAFIPDSPDRTWARTLLKKIPRRRFDFVYSNNKRVQKQLRKSGILYRGGPVTLRHQLQGKRIRKWRTGWEKNVPKPVAQKIRKWIKTKPIGGKPSYPASGTMNRT